MPKEISSGGPSGVPSNLPPPPPRRKGQMSSGQNVTPLSPKQGESANTANELGCRTIPGQSATTGGIKAKGRWSQQLPPPPPPPRPKKEGQTQGRQPSVSTEEPPLPPEDAEEQRQLGTGRSHRTPSGLPPPPPRQQAARPSPKTEEPVSESGRPDVAEPGTAEADPVDAGQGKRTEEPTQKRGWFSRFRRKKSGGSKRSWFGRKSAKPEQVGATRAKKVGSSKMSTKRSWKFWKKKGGTTGKADVIVRKSLASIDPSKSSGEKRPFAAGKQDWVSGSYEGLRKQNRLQAQALLESFGTSESTPDLFKDPKAIMALGKSINQRQLENLFGAYEFDRLADQLDSNHLSDKEVVERFSDIDSKYFYASEDDINEGRQRTESQEKRSQLGLGFMRGPVEAPEEINWNECDSFEDALSQWKKNHEGKVEVNYSKTDLIGDGVKYFRRVCDKGNLTQQDRKELATFLHKFSQYLRGQGQGGLVKQGDWKNTEKKFIKSYLSL